jgi:uncharacterized protein (DUF433 family)
VNCRTEPDLPFVIGRGHGFSGAYLLGQGFGSCAGDTKYTKIGRMQRFDRITWNPHQMNGQPCIRGMRLTVRRVVESVALYPNRDDLFRNYPELEPDDVQQALGFAAANLEQSAAESNAA